MLLKMKRGQEHGLVITQDIQSKDNIMYVAYSQALDAVREIVRQAREFSSLNSDGKKAKLYSYSHNIIAFSGSRGQGKTSAMLSFSQGLASAEEKEKLQDCSFTILDPIDPTVLEENQGILAVILSRMYRLAEESWQESFKSHNSTFGHSHSEADKNAILGLFQKCLSGITAVKFRRGEEIKSLQIVHEISDSSLLKENFYRLTDKLLHFTSPGPDGTHSSRHPFLVIQLDDTDFQIQKAYDILDDIRKYLTIPNVIILMATDMDLLRHTLTQHYLKEFSTGLQWETIGRTEVRKLESKYLDKLIPPTFAVYLPHIDDLVRQQERLQLNYQDPEDPKRGNLLLPPDCPCTAADFSFQALVLRYIYQKTHIIFAEPGAHIHNLIPTTLRGLSQFLGLLSSMKDAPEVKLDDFPPEEEARKLPVEKARESAKLLAKDVLEESEVLETNLRLFEDYFLYDWVHTKLPKAEGDIIEQLSRTMPGERCRAAIIALRGYKKPKEQGKEDPMPDTASDDYSYSVLVDEIEKRKNQNRLLTDFYFTFAIQTFFSIQFHKAVVYQKMRAAQAFLEDDSLENDLLLFDFTPEKLDLPWCFDLKVFVDKLENGNLAAMLDEKQLEDLKKELDDKFSSDILIQVSSGNVNRFSSMNLLKLFLTLGSEDGQKLARGDFYHQKEIYLIQTSTISALINWDVHERIRKIPVERVEEPYGNHLRAFLEKADNAAQDINKPRDRIDKKQALPMVLGHLKGIMLFASDTESRSKLTHVLRNAIEHFDPAQEKLKNLCRVYEGAMRLKKCLAKNLGNYENVMLTYDALHDYTDIYRIACRANSLHRSRVLIDSIQLENELRKIIHSSERNDPDTHDGKVRLFKTLNAQFKDLCNNYNITKDHVLEYAKTRSMKHD